MSGIIQPLFVQNALGSLTNTANLSNASGGASVNFTNTSIGTASSDRYIIVAAAGGGASSCNISGITIAGNAMTKESGNSANAFTVTGIYRLLVTAGTNATITVSFSGNVSQWCSISVYALKSFGTISAPFDSATTTSTSNPVSLTANTRIGGCAIMIASRFQTTTAPTVSSFTGCDTENYNVVNNTTNRTWVGDLSPTQVVLNKSFTVTFSGGTTTSSTLVTY